MNNLLVLKEQIENGVVPNFPLIFVYEDNTFLCEQYLEKILSNCKKECVYLEDVDELSQLQDSSIFEETKDVLYVIKQDKVESMCDKPCVVFTQSVDKSLDKYSYSVPKMKEEWVKDYLYSKLSFADKDTLKWLEDSICGNVYEVDRLIKTIELFDEDFFKSFMIRQMIDDQLIVPNNQQTMTYKFSDGVVHKKKEEIVKLYDYVKSEDSSILQMVALLYGAFKKQIQVLLSKNPTEETTGLKSSVIYAIRNNPCAYNRNQLISAFDFLTSVDYEVKTGKTDTKILFDYILCKLFSM